MDLQWVEQTTLVGRFRQLSICRARHEIRCRTFLCGVTFFARDNSGIRERNFSSARMGPLHHLRELRKTLPGIHDQW